VSWTVGGPFSLALHLKPVGAERPDWHAAELLITAFSLFYGAGDIFRVTNLNALLKTTRWMPVRADQILKKTGATLDHGCNFPVVLWLPLIAVFPMGRELYQRRSRRRWRRSVRRRAGFGSTGSSELVAILRRFIFREQLRR
jgi:hypothetical protein